MSSLTIAKYFIADQTYQNLLCLIRGFFGYANCILSYSDKETLVPGLYSNQSSIEGLFSRMRAMKRDFTYIYYGSILHQNIFSSLAVSKKKNGNSLYQYIMIGEEKVSENNSCDRLSKDVIHTRQLTRNIIHQEHLSKRRLLVT